MGEDGGSCGLLLRCLLLGFNFISAELCCRGPGEAITAESVLGLQTCYNNLLAHRTGWDRSPDNDESVVQKIRREDWKTFQEANESSDR